MSRFNRKGSVKRGGRKRVHRDRKGQPVPSKALRESGNDFAIRHVDALKKLGLRSTARQESKFRNGYGALHRAINHA